MLITLRALMLPFFLCLLPSLLYGQTLTTMDSSAFLQRVAPAPASVLESFRAAGLQPTEHVLTNQETRALQRAFALLPPVYARVFKDHLHSISFLDNMPNTALTSPVAGADSVRRYNITFRAGILQETISEWATKKEMTCYDTIQGGNLRLHIDGGSLPAIVYVLLHEGAHVIDAVLNITPHPADRSDVVAPTTFTKRIWEKMNQPGSSFMDTLLEQTRFRSGGVVPITKAPAVYRALQHQPFVSLYAMASRFEDLAELATIYHLTKKLDQPFSVDLYQGDKMIFQYVPMKNPLVQQRLSTLSVFDPDL
ncbi:hypothetical protein LZZ85_22025 [Terrimonas sp. NA20]|uniref:Secreted protein n=1 Tax=Terrimonas ginsenosidimutans TaxID=2908004 RepID=A0ABS9KXF0_9BACT|nr:hypothetical protein [Terrimonas ginsenosidimutans]MCG2616991.1 hypothetical protein [Terrimonas ginsenosidimutans]